MVIIYNYVLNFCGIFIIYVGCLRHLIEYKIRKEKKPLKNINSNGYHVKCKICLLKISQRQFT